MISFFKHHGASVTHLEEPSVYQLRFYLRETLVQAVLAADKAPVSLWVYVTGHSFLSEEGIKVLLNEQLSFSTRKNPYPLEYVLADLCTEHNNLTVEVLNDCCL